MVEEQPPQRQRARLLQHLIDHRRATDLGQPHGVEVTPDLPDRHRGLRGCPD